MILFTTDISIPIASRTLFIVAISLFLITIVGLVFPSVVGRSKNEKNVPSLIQTVQIPHTMESTPNIVIDEKLLLRDTYIELRTKLAQNYSIFLEPGFTEREILNLLLKGNLHINKGILSEIYGVYELSRFSLKTIEKGELKQAIQMAEDLAKGVQP